MRAIIVGCGRVGVMLAHLLDQGEHHVTVVDKNPSAFRRLASGFRGRTVAGVGFDRDVLREAGIEQVDGFAAVTSGDNSNFIAVTVAHDTFAVPVVVARVYDPQREQIYRRLGIHTISSTVWAAHKIRQLLLNDTTGTAEALGNGEVRLVQARVNEAVVGRTVHDLCADEIVNVYAIVRKGAAFIPASDTVLQLGDTLYISVAAAASERIQALLR